MQRMPPCALDDAAAAPASDPAAAHVQPSAPACADAAVDSTTDGPRTPVHHKHKGGQRGGARRQPLGVLQPNTVMQPQAHTQEPLSASKPSTRPHTLHTPAKSTKGASFSSVQPSPGGVMLREFVDFLSPEIRRVASAAVAPAAVYHDGSADAEAQDAAMEAPPQTAAVHMSMSFDAAEEEQNVDAYAPGELPSLPRSSAVALLQKSPMSLLTDATAPHQLLGHSAPRGLTHTFESSHLGAPVQLAPMQAVTVEHMQPVVAIAAPAAAVAAAAAATAATPLSRPASRAAGRKSVGADSLHSYTASISPSFACPTAAPPSSSPSSASPRFPCTQCPKSFPSNSALLMHCLVHKDVKPYECPWEGCSKSFRQKGHLTSHHRKHTGSKPFGCPALLPSPCGKWFKDKSGLNSHCKRQHPGVDCSHVTAVATTESRTEDEAEHDLPLQEAIARGNKILVQMQAEQESAPVAVASPVDAGAFHPISTAATANASSFMDAPSSSSNPLHPSRKRSHHSMGGSPSELPSSFLQRLPDDAFIPIASSLPTPTSTLDSPSSQLLGAPAGDSTELELERLVHGSHTNASTSLMHQSTMTPASTRPASSSSSAALTHPSRVLKRSRSESVSLLGSRLRSDSPASVMTHKLSLQGTGGASGGASSPSLSALQAMLDQHQQQQQSQHVRPASRASMGHFSPLPSSSPVLFSGSAMPPSIAFGQAVMGSANQQQLLAVLMASCDARTNRAVTPTGITSAAFTHAFAASTYSPTVMPAMREQHPALSGFQLAHAPQLPPPGMSVPLQAHRSSSPSLGLPLNSSSSSAFSWMATGGSASSQ